MIRETALLKQNLRMGTTIKWLNAIRNYMQKVELVNGPVSHPLDNWYCKGKRKADEHMVVAGLYTENYVVLVPH